jgi:hypothetical protein
MIKDSFNVMLMKMVSMVEQSKQMSIEKESQREMLRSMTRFKEWLNHDFPALSVHT